MATEVMKVEVELETCCICGTGGELLSPEEHDAGALPMQVPLRTMLLHLNSNKVVPEGRLCSSCIRRTMESYEFSTAISARGVPPLSEKIRALRRRLHELTQKIDVFIVVGGAGAGGTYSEEDIIMVERDTLAAAAAADDEDLERARNARGDSVYQCSVCPQSFQRVSEYRAHARSHPADALHSCWTCGAMFASGAALRAHAAGACGAGPACALCGRGAAARHAAGCRPRCPACGALLASRQALAAHAAAAHGKAARPPHVCAACFRTCDTPELLSAHLLRHRQAKQFVCGYDGCILRFATRNNLMSHIRKCHSGAVEVAAANDASAAEPEPEPAAPVTTCDTCGRTFGSAAAMKRHARVHRSTRHAPQPLALQEEAAEWGDDAEGEVEYLEVDELDDADYAHDAEQDADMN
ncbi:GDNF-inducible zinc finger protein 1-like [Trichoplusia ni]|uniref:GDNF-inducible zinc finger protein 1-like n=1 Tax=Trichoplusia ni TaxID=7111 RepID=A0A7E5VP96_TRINI|nr:GDNF-inducible zinc finger protein 1-like [Trichoplusia ni]